MLKIFLADDHRIVREGLGSLIARTPGLELVGEAEDGVRAVEGIKQCLPDVAVIDISMPQKNGIQVMREISATLPSIKIVALSMHSDRRYVIEALTAGAKAYVLKDSAFEELSSAIYDIENGRTFLSPPLNNVSDSDNNQPSNQASLTPRENEILKLLAEGQTTKEMAYSLNIGIKTVETHRLRLMGKLGLYSVAELTKYAIRHGITCL